MRINRFKFIALGVLSAMAFILMAATARAQVRLIGTAHVAGTQSDLSGLSDILAGGVPHDRFGGISAIDYVGHGSRYLVLADRGPQDGAVKFACRVHAVDISVGERHEPPVTVSLHSTTLLRNHLNHHYVGDAAAFSAAHATEALRFDPEGLRVGVGERFFVSDEYGPLIIEFNANGRKRAAVPVPSRFRIAIPEASKKAENSANEIGRQSNAGMEGLAISADAKKLYGIMQAPLLQDSRRNANGKLSGTCARLLEIHLETGSTREFLYPLHNAECKLSEVLALGPERFLVIERDGNAGVAAGVKHIVLVDIENADDISDIDSLPPDALPQDVIPVRKQIFIDLLDPNFALAGDSFPEKPEGLCWGPKLSDGGNMLIVAVDNDFYADSPSRFIVFDTETLGGP